MGIFGFLFVMAWKRRALLPPDFLHNLLQSLVVLVLLGILAWQIIDNAAHLGGLIAGGGLGLWIFRNPNGTLPIQDSHSLRIIGITSEFGFLGLTIFTIFKLLG